MLVTDGGNGQGRSALAAVRALAGSDYLAAVTTSGPGSIAAASRYCRRQVPVPNADQPGYAEAVRAELDDRPYLTVLPASDRALVALGRDTALLDKGSLVDAARAVGIESPAGTVFPSIGELREAAAHLPYPAVVKPTISRFTAMRIDEPLDIERLAGAEGPLLVQPFVRSPLRSISGVMWRGRLVAAVHQRYLRTWPAACGGACAAETVDPDRELEERVGPLLVDHEGLFHVQFAGDLLLDVNPRVYGSHPLADRAGANLVRLWCDLLRGIAPPARILRGRSGVFYRSLEGDLRHRIWAVRSRRTGLREAIASLRPRAGAAHGPESVTDPGPLLARARFAAGRFLSRST